MLALYSRFCIYLTDPDPESLGNGGKSTVRDCGYATARGIGVPDLLNRIHHEAAYLNSHGQPFTKLGLGSFDSRFYPPRVILDHAWSIIAVCGKNTLPLLNLDPLALVAQGVSLTHEVHCSS